MHSTVIRELTSNLLKVSQIAHLSSCHQMVTIVLTLSICFWQSGWNEHLDFRRVLTMGPYDSANDGKSDSAGGGVLICPAANATAANTLVNSMFFIAECV